MGNRLSSRTWEKWIGFSRVSLLLFTFTYLQILRSFSKSLFEVVYWNRFRNMRSTSKHLHPVFHLNLNRWKSEGVDWRFSTPPTTNTYGQPTMSQKRTNASFPENSERQPLQAAPQRSEYYYTYISIVMLLSTSSVCSASTLARCTEPEPGNLKLGHSVVIENKSVLCEHYTKLAWGTYRRLKLFKYPAFKVKNEDLSYYPLIRIPSIRVEAFRTLSVVHTDSFHM